MNHSVKLLRMFYKITFFVFRSGRVFVCLIRPKCCSIAKEYIRRDKLHSNPEIFICIRYKSSVNGWIKCHAQNLRGWVCNKTHFSGRGRHINHLKRHTKQRLLLGDKGFHNRMLLRNMVSISEDTSLQK